MVTNISLLRSPGNVIELYTAEHCLIHPRHNSLGREKYLLPRFNPDSLDSLVFSPRLFQGKSRVCQQLSRETRSLPGGRGRTGRPGPPSGSDITPHAPLSLTPELRPPLVMLHFKSLSLYFLLKFLDCIDWYLIWCFIARNVQIIFHSRNLTLKFLMSLL